MRAHFEDFKVALKAFESSSEPERTFRIGLVTADVGNWILLQFPDKIGDPATYKKIQDILFAQISVYKNIEGAAPIPMRVFVEGRWMEREIDLEYDVEAFSRLMKEALEFNMGPFLRKLIAEEKASRVAELLAMSQPPSQTA